MSEDVVKIDGRAWVPKSIFPNRALRRVKNDNIVKLRPGPYDDEPTMVKVYGETPTHIGLPRAFYEHTSSGTMDVEYDVSTRSLDLECHVEPRDELQRSCIRNVTRRLQSRKVTQTLFKSGTGTGKSCLSLMVASKLNLAPLILVHQTSIMSGWIEQISENPGVFPDANVGIFQGDTEEFGDDYDIVIGMIQTLANRDTDHPVFSWPGILLVDEVHRVSAPTFSRVVPRFNASKKLGFSATIRRKDNGEPIFHKELGDVCWEGGQTSMEPVIYPVRTNFYVKDDKPKWLERKFMIKDEDRNDLIVNEIVNSVEAGRNTMVMTSSLSHIALLKTKFESVYDEDISIGLCCGAYFLDEDDAISWITDWSDYQDQFDKEELVEWYLSEDDSPPDSFDPSIHKINFDWSGEYESSVLEASYKEIQTVDGESIDQEQFEVSKVLRWIKIGKTYSAPEPFDPEKHKVVFEKPIKGILLDAYKEVIPKKETISTKRFDDEEVNKDLLFATFGKIKEGFNEPRLDAGILAIPKSDPEQLVGRFTREHPDKKDPVFTHFVDDRMGKYEYIWNEKATKVYKGMGAKILPLPDID